MTTAGLSGFREGLIPSVPGLGDTPLWDQRVPAVDTTGPPRRLGEDECHYLPSAPFVHHSPC